MLNRPYQNVWETPLAQVASVPVDMLEAFLATYAAYPPRTKAALLSFLSR